MDSHGIPLHGLSSCAFVSPAWTDDFAALAAAPLVDVQRDGIPLPLSRWDEAVFCSRQLPLRPIWPAFAINTVFYAVGLWGLFAAPFALRRRRRIRRGLCPKCAYDLRNRPTDSTTCPECGATVAPASKALQS